MSKGCMDLVLILDYDFRISYDQVSCCFSFLFVLLTQQQLNAVVAFVSLLMNQSFPQLTFLSRCPISERGHGLISSPIVSY